MQYLIRISRAVRDRTRRAVKAAASRWHRHHHRMTSESGYAEALTDVLLAAVELLVSSYRVRCLVQAFAHAYVWVMRAFRPPHQGWT